jgi:hypothetical protein
VAVQESGGMDNSSSRRRATTARHCPSEGATWPCKGPAVGTTTSPAFCLHAAPYALMPPTYRAVGARGHRDCQWKKTRKCNGPVQRPSGRESKSESNITNNINSAPRAAPVLPEAIAYSHSPHQGHRAPHSGRPESTRSALSAHSHSILVEIRGATWLPLARPPLSRDGRQWTRQLIILQTSG